MNRRRFVKAAAAGAVGGVLLGSRPGLGAGSSEQTAAKGGKVPEDNALPFMYRDITQGKYIQWMLGYTFPLIVAVVDRIPREKSWASPAPNVDPAAWILGAVVNNEDGKMSFLTGKPKITGNVLEPFRCPAVSSSMTPEAEGVVDKARLTVDFMLEKWMAVRTRTDAYLEKVADAALKVVPDRSSFNPDNKDPVREEFVMLTYQQNVALGKLLLVEQLLAGSAVRTEFPSFSESDRLLKSKYGSLYRAPR